MSNTIDLGDSIGLGGSIPYLRHRWFHSMSRCRRFIPTITICYHIQIRNHLISALLFLSSAPAQALNDVVFPARPPIFVITLLLLLLCSNVEARPGRNRGNKRFQDCNLRPLRENCRVVVIYTIVNGIGTGCISNIESKAPAPNIQNNAHIGSSNG